MLHLEICVSKCHICGEKCALSHAKVGQGHKKVGEQDFDFKNMDCPS